MNKDTNILKKILAIQIQQYMEKIIHYDQVGFILEIQGFFKIQYGFWINMAHHINQYGTPHQEIKEPYDHLNRCRKSLTKFNTHLW